MFWQVEIERAVDLKPGYLLAWDDDQWFLWDSFVRMPYTRVLRCAIVGTIVDVEQGSKKGEIKVDLQVFKNRYGTPGRIMYEMPLEVIKLFEEPER